MIVPARMRPPPLSCERSAATAPSMTTPPDHRIRPAQDADLPFQESLYATTRQEELDAAGFPQEMRAAFIQMQFNAQTVHYQKHYANASWDIIECQDQPVGRVIVYRGSEEWRVVDIAIMPEWRGRGIGSSVLQAIMSECAATGLPLRMTAFSQERAIHLYLRLGFRAFSDDGLFTGLEWISSNPPD